MLWYTIGQGRWGPALVEGVCAGNGQPFGGPARSGRQACMGVGTTNLGRAMASNADLDRLPNGFLLFLQKELLAQGRLQGFYI